MTDSELDWIDGALTSARPQAIGALLRYFRDLDTAEEAFQEACLRAIKNWRQNGPLIVQNGQVNPHTADSAPEERRVMLRTIVHPN